MEKISVLVADDHAVLRWGLGALINSQPDMEVVAEAEDGEATVEQVRTAQPDVVLLDLTMPKLSGLRVLHRLRDEAPDARVLVLTMHSDPAYVRPALAAGAFGYVVKTSAGTELLAAIRSVHAGRPFVDPSTAQGVVAQLLIGGGTQGFRQRGALSTREKQVLGLLARGYTNHEAAERLGVSVKTVETHRSRVCRKLGVRTRAELVQYALLEGLMGDEPTDGEQ